MESETIDGYRSWLGDSNVADNIACFDWAATPLGSIHGWPPSLKTVAALVVRSPAAMVLLWGPQGTLIYNDAYALICGARHPSALGSEVRKSWPEIADFNANVMDTVLRGKTLTYRDQELTIHRNGRAEQAWFTLDYSPALDDSGTPAGAMAVVVETTAKVSAESWLSGERDRLRQMFDQAPGFMALLTGPAHVFELVNFAYLQLIGHRPVVSKSVREALPELEGQGFYELLDGVFSSGEAFSGTAMPVMLSMAAAAAPAREQRYVDLVYQPLRDAAGKVQGIFVQGTDVTDRVAAEQAVRASEARHRQILDSATDYAIVALDAQGRITRWNEGAHRILGWSETEMLGQQVDRIFTPEDRAVGKLQAEMQRATEGRGRNDEGWRLRASGERFWAAGEMTQIRDAGGVLTGFVKVLRDRTDQYRANEALRLSEERLRRAQQAGRVGTFTVVLDSSVVSGTSEFYRIFGLEPVDSVPAACLESLVLPEDAAVVSNAASRGNREAPLDVEYRIHRANDGALRWISRTAEYECDAEGKALRMVGLVQDVTERKAAQRAIEESAAQFRTFAQALPNHVWTAPADGLLDWFNDRVYEYSGAAPGDLDGGGWTRIVHPDDLPEAGRRWSASLASGESYEVEFRIRRADGTYRWHLVRGVPMRTADGGISRWVGTNTDIHERKLAEVESTRDRNRIWALSQEIMLICDFSGVITSVNPAATRLLGWSEEEMTGRSLGDYVHPGDLAQTAAEVEKLSRGATTLAFENRYRAKDGSYLLLDWTAVPDGDLIHGVGRNITGERAANEERERIWISMNDLMATTGRNGLLRSTNPAWKRLLGYDESDLAARPFSDVVHPDDRVAFTDIASRLARAEFVPEFEIRMLHKEQGHALLAWTADYVGDFLYLVGRNVTEQRAVEDVLRQAQKMEAVGQLTGGIAHDFNNLLQGIAGSLGLIQKRISQGRHAEVNRYVGDALNSTRRAAALTHRLLAFSRRQPLDPRPVDANPLIASMEDLLHRTLGERISMRMQLASDLWMTRCDPNQLENAILNAAINSRDAMPEGGTLTIETANVVFADALDARRQGIEPGSYVSVSVSDTGEGMSSDTVARAFEPFFTTKPLGQGTGLGLSMIYGFARQSEGYAKVHSQLGQGTTLKLYLPLHAGIAAEEQRTPDMTIEQGLRAHERVLILEDEPVVRALIVEVLGELGYDALQAADGPAGLAILQSTEPIDLLITDIGLPGLNGRQVAEVARLTRPHLKILFMTGYAADATVAAGFLESGMALITKPFAMDALAVRVRELIRA